MCYNLIYKGEQLGLSFFNPITHFLKVCRSFTALKSFSLCRVWLELSEGLASTSASKLHMSGEAET